MTPGNNMKVEFTVNIDSSSSAYRAAGTQANKDSIDIHPVVRFNGDIIGQLDWARRQGFTFRGRTSHPLTSVPDTTPGLELSKLPFARS
jgi:hypothetical protein